MQAGWAFSQSGENMNGQDSARVEAFKRSIGYDKIAEPLDSNKGVVLEWPDPLTSPQLRDGSWKLAAEVVLCERGGVVRKWAVQKADEVISISVFVAGDGNKAAREYLLWKASETMTVDVPYAKAAAPLGTLCVVAKGDNQDLIWLFQNVCIQIRGMEAAINVAEVAHWLQQLVEAHVVDNLAAYKPGVQEFKVSASRVAVGGTVHLNVILHTPAEASRYFLGLDHDDGISVDTTPEDPLAARLTALRAGRNTILAQVVNKKTLLSTSAPCVLDVGN
jgi:hypothetical protein